MLALNVTPEDDFPEPTFCDYESRSRTNLKTHGHFPYFNDPSTSILMVGVGHRDWSRTQVTKSLTSGRMREYRPRQYISWGSIDYEMYRTCEKHPDQGVYWFDAMQLALFVGLPGKLEDCARVLGIQKRKMKSGKWLINKFSIPKPDGTFNQLTDFPDDRKTFKKYARQDVDLMMEIWYEHLVQFLPLWIRYWEANFGMIDRMNARGVPINVEASIDALEVVETEQARLVDKCIEKYGISPSQTEPLTKFLGLPNCQKRTLEEALPYLDKHGRRLAKLRLQTAKTSKLRSMIDMSCVDGRVHYAFISNGAHTGRLSCRNPQFHNMRKFKYDRELFERLRKMKKIKKPIETISNAARGFVKSPEGHIFMCSDALQIEARVGAWLAGEEKLLRVFRNNGDPYLMMAANIYGIPMEDLDKDGPERQQGKITILAGQYQVSGKGLRTQAIGWGITGISLERWNEIVKNYRGTFPCIVKYWWALEAALRELVENPGLRQTTAGEIKFRRKGKKWIAMVLPSGRSIWYYKCKVRTVLRQREILIKATGEIEIEEYEKDVIFRWTKMGWDSLYGGKLFENAVQAISADIMLYGGRQAEDHGFKLIMSVHDEWVAQMKKAHATVERLAEFNRVLAIRQPWAMPIPIVYEGWIDNLYRK